MNISIKKSLISFFVAATFFTADVFPSPPILRIEVGQHTALISRMAVDKEAKLLATASHDKTVRLWNLPEGSLYGTLRVPIGDQLDGALYAVAVSPDGKTVIASGQTIGNDQNFSLYIFDVEKRVVKERISNLPSVVFHLAYSKDGKYFAAALGNGLGIRVWDSQTGALVFKESYSDERCNWLAFNELGNLATVSFDGYVRIYDSHFTLLKKAKVSAQGKPKSISFSGNGQLLAIGYLNLMQVDIADMNLNVLKSLPTENLIGTHTGIVTWKKNSNTALYASGDIRTKDGNVVIRHWQDIDSSSAKYNDIKVSTDTVTDIISVSDNGDSKIDTLFSSADPSWGGIKENNLIFKNQAMLWNAHIVELANKTFSISDDGLTIAYSQQLDSNKLTVFDINNRTLKTYDDGSDQLFKSLSPTIKESQTIKIITSQNDIPIFNGKKLILEKLERSLAWAINKESSYALFGSNYYLRMYDAHGNETKKVPVPAEVWAVNIAANGKLAVAALGDGTIHWYSLSPGEELDELVTLFPYSNEYKDWIIWTKDGFFGSSDGGGYRLAGYHLNKGENKRPEWIDFSQIYQTYYAPELILPKLLRQEDKIKIRLNNIGNIDERFNKNEIPIIELVEYCIDQKHANTKAFIRTSTSTKNNATELSYYERFKLTLYEILEWFKTLIGTESTKKVDFQIEQNSPQNMHTCNAIVSQVATRNYIRNEKNKISTPYNFTLSKNTDSVDLSFIVKPRKGGIGDIDIYVNDQIQSSHKQLPSLSSDVDQQDLKLTKSLNLKEGDNTILIQAYEKTGGATAKSDAITLYNPPANRSANIEEIKKPKLIIFSVGIDHYESKENKLLYAVKDSDDFLTTVSKNKSSIYSEVKKYQLKDKEATRKNIESTFNKIKQNLDKQDTVLIYFSGHGVIEDGKNNKQGFYFIPYGVDESNYADTALSQGVIKDYITMVASISNKIFIFLDSCHSGAVDLNVIDAAVTSFDKIKNQLGDNIFILAAAAENQEALDSFRLTKNINSNNGLFAYAVLNGLNGQAASKSGTTVNSIQLGDYVQSEINKITENQTSYNQKARFQKLNAGDITSFEITESE